MVLAFSHTEQSHYLLEQLSVPKEKNIFMFPLLVFYQSFYLFTNLTVLCPNDLLKQYNSALSVDQHKGCLPGSWNQHNQLTFYNANAFSCILRSGTNN